MAPEVPLAIFKNVFGNEHAQRLLLFLEEAQAPIRYSQARDTLEFHPEEFRRALKALQDYSMVQYRAPSFGTEGKRAVYIELTILGRLFADLWREMNEDLAKLMEERHIPTDVLTAIAEG